jgi:catechol 2,3-dioxygenase-like lactoylglutathione lyase family enzyme
MSPLRRFDHVGITVQDLETAADFFIRLGFEVEGRTFLEGEFIDAVIGMPNSRTEIVSLRPPGGGTGFELARFIRPAAEAGSPTAMANQLGLRSISFEVEGLKAILDGLAAVGYRAIGTIGEYEGSWRMASVRGPEGIIVSFAERLSPR